MDCLFVEYESDDISQWTVLSDTLPAGIILSSLNDRIYVECNDLYRAYDTNAVTSPVSRLASKCRVLIKLLLYITFLSIPLTITFFKYFKYFKYSCLSLPRLEHEEYSRIFRSLFPMSVAFSIAESIMNASIISDALTAEDRSKELSRSLPNCSCSSKSRYRLSCFHQRLLQRYYTSDTQQTRWLDFSRVRWKPVRLHVFGRFSLGACELGRVRQG